MHRKLVCVLHLPHLASLISAPKLHSTQVYRTLAFWTSRRNSHVWCQQRWTSALSNYSSPGESSASSKLFDVGTEAQGPPSLVYGVDKPKAKHNLGSGIF